MATETLKVLNLKVRAKRTSEHAFNMSGIIESVNAVFATYGASISAYDIRTQLYPLLDRRETTGTGETGHLIYDSKKIRDTLLPVSFCMLSNEIVGAELDQLILQRQSLFLSRYKFISEMHDFVRVNYPSKIKTLEDLLTLAGNHFQALDDEYDRLNIKISSPKIVTKTKIAGISTHQKGTTTIKENEIPKQTHEVDITSSMRKKVGNTWVEVGNNWNEPANPTDPPPADAVALSQQTDTTYENDEKRHPRIENEMRYKRVTADLMDEILSEKLFNLSVPHLPLIWANELKDFDLEIRKRQIQYTETFLFPRISGRVTGIMKNAGENVRAGEPVVKIEDDSVLLLVGQLKSTKPIVVGQQASVIAANIFEASQTPVELPGKVVSVRGYDSQRDRWDITLECQNFNDGERLPLGYEFETDAGQTMIKYNFPN